MVLEAVTNKYSLGYDFSGFRSPDQCLVVTVNTVPSNLDEIGSNDGPNIYVSPIGRICFEFTRGTRVGFTPWVPVNISPMIIPLPRMNNQVNVRTVEHLEQGVSWMIEVVSISSFN